MDRRGPLGFLSRSEGGIRRPIAGRVLAVAIVAAGVGVFWVVIDAYWETGDLLLPLAAAVMLVFSIFLSYDFLTNDDRHAKGRAQLRADHPRLYRAGVWGRRILLGVFILVVLVDWLVLGSIQGPGEALVYIVLMAVLLALYAYVGSAAMGKALAAVDKIQSFRDDLRSS